MAVWTPDQSSTISVYQSKALPEFWAKRIISPGFARPMALRWISL